MLSQKTNSEPQQAILAYFDSFAGVWVGSRLPSKSLVKGLCRVVGFLPNETVWTGGSGLQGSDDSQYDGQLPFEAPVQN